ncbi:MAG: PP2C family protein-serine/threonine phosphatase, partial [Egibacteraceae bacterium]
VALCIMDVSGHGAVTGVFALQAKNLLLAALRQRLDPGEALGWLAATLGDTGDLFLTTVLVYLDPVSGHCRYANAGHPPPLVAGGRRLRQLNPTGPLLGPMPGTWLTETTDLAPGEVLVAYTDGVTEARNDRRAEFGTERLEPLVRGHAVLGPQALVDACVDAVRDFSNGRIADDLTLLAVSRHA